MVRVDRRLLLGTQAEPEEALSSSEDSSTLNTSFIERHSLTIRRAVRILAVVHLVTPEVRNSWKAR